MKPREQLSSHEALRGGGPDLSVEGALALLHISRSSLHHLIRKGLVEGYISDPKTGRWISLSSLPGRKNKAKREIKFYREDLEQFRKQYRPPQRKYQLGPSSIPISEAEQALMTQMAQQQLQESGFITRNRIVQALEDQFGIPTRKAWEKVNRLAYEQHWPLNLSRIPHRARRRIFVSMPAAPSQEEEEDASGTDTSYQPPGTD